MFLSLTKKWELKIEQKQGKSLFYAVCAFYWSTIKNCKHKIACSFLWSLGIILHFIQTSNSASKWWYNLSGFCGLKAGFRLTTHSYNIASIKAAVDTVILCCRGSLSAKNISSREWICHQSLGYIMKTILFHGASIHF